MPTRRVTPIRFWNGSAWTEGMVPVYNDKGTYKMLRIWYSNDSVNWAPTDLADVVMTPPSVVNSMSATVNSSSQITVNWAAPSTPGDLIGYRLQGQAGGVPADMFSGSNLLNGANQLSYVHGGLSGSTYYGYRCAGMTSDGQYGASATAGATTNAAYTDYYAEFGRVDVGAWTGSAWESQGGGGRVRQSNSSGSNYNGYWFYGDNLKNNISGATILDGDFYFSRQASGSGPSGVVPVQLGLHGYTYKPGNPGSWTGALPATYNIARGAFQWTGTGGWASTAAAHVAGDINGAWRGIMCGGMALTVNNTYVSYGSSATDPANDPAGNWRIWWRRYG